MKEDNVARLAELLPYPPVTAHKYSRGKTIVVAGSTRYPGAAALAAHATERLGSGYTEVLTAPEVLPILQGYRPSLVVRSWKTKALQLPIVSSLENPCAYVVGCGVDEHDKAAASLIHTILERTEAPVLLDGGALALMATDEGLALCQDRCRKGLSTVFTPHVGEAHRLLGRSQQHLSGIEELSQCIAATWGVVVVVKGSDVAISDGEESLAITLGSPALAKAGTGDVLAGMIGALLAQNLETVDACVLGTMLHAEAGNKAAEALTMISVTAEDVIAAIPQAIKTFSAGKV